MKYYSTPDIPLSRGELFFQVPPPSHQGPLFQSHSGDAGQAVNNRYYLYQFQYQTALQPFLLNR
jgi:hypothetical protein